MSKSADGESLISQIERLSNFIMQEIPGEPSRDQGAVDTAIRLLRDRAKAIAQARKEALEEAARMCVYYLLELASAIRALASLEEVNP